MTKPIDQTSASSILTLEKLICLVPAALFIGAGLYIASGDDRFSWSPGDLQLAVVMILGLIWIFFIVLACLGLLARLGSGKASFGPRWAFRKIVALVLQALLIVGGVFSFVVTTDKIHIGLGFAIVGSGIAIHAIRSMDRPSVVSELVALVDPVECRWTSGKTIEAVLTALMIGSGLLMYFRAESSDSSEIGLLLWLFGAIWTASIMRDYLWPRPDYLPFPISFIYRLICSL